MEEEIRLAAFLWLKERARLNGGVYSWSELTGEFAFQGKKIPLVGVPGIWTPRPLTTPISIRTSVESPYDDGLTADDFFRYAYRGTDPNHIDNRRLREARVRRVPLIYFEAVSVGRYVAEFPVIVVDDEPTGLFFRIASEPAYSDLGFRPSGRTFDSDEGSTLGMRRYATAMAKLRLHQTAFRERVIGAYNRQCAMCRLQHPELLDAAHIIPDSQEGGDPIVQNGLSLCKIHHAAYDRNILGVTPEFEIRVQQKVLEEVDGPMLKYGLQSLDRQQLILPKHRTDYPDRDRLEKRFSLFAS